MLFLAASSLVRLLRKIKGPEKAWDAERQRNSMLYRDSAIVDLAFVGTDCT
jgi:hypothetical protein